MCIYIYIYIQMYWATMYDIDNYKTLNVQILNIRLIHNTGAKHAVLKSY
jgi:hypothetical protein